MVKINPLNMVWMNDPERFIINKKEVFIETSPYTSLWSRTYFKTVSSNAPILVLPVEKNFTFSAKVSYTFKEVNDQAGIVVYANENNYLKACVLRYNNKLNLLSTTLTHHGYSDMACREIGEGINTMYFRLSHRDGDFLVENSFDGVHYKQMRLFHLRMREGQFNIGVYACSPNDSSFDSKFSNLRLTKCIWKEYEEGEKIAWDLEKD
jgi:regulation of enolase protein 1 (concanavalin A-like superfamily)